jgi:hypothetical protein
MTVSLCSLARIDLPFVPRIRNLAQVTGSADVMLLGLAQFVLVAFGSDCQKASGADRVDCAITIVLMREHGAGGLGHCWPDFWLLSGRKQ